MYYNECNGLWATIKEGKNTKPLACCKGLFNIIFKKTISF